MGAQQRAPATGRGGLVDIRRQCTAFDVRITTSAPGTTTPAVCFGVNCPSGADKRLLIPIDVPRQILTWNLFSGYDYANDTLQERRSRGCHGFGHTFGLRHPVQRRGRRNLHAPLQRRPSRAPGFSTTSTTSTKLLTGNPGEGSEDGRSREVAAALLGLGGFGRGRRSWVNDNNENPTRRTPSGDGGEAAQASSGNDDQATEGSAPQPRSEVARAWRHLAPGGAEEVEHFATLAELSDTTDVVITGVVTAAAPGRSLEDGNPAVDGQIYQFLELTIEVQDDLADAANAQYSVEFGPYLQEDLTAATSAAATLVNDEGVFVLRRKGSANPETGAPPSGCRVRYEQVPPGQQPRPPPQRRGRSGRAVSRGPRLPRKPRRCRLRGNCRTRRPAR